MKELIGEFNTIFQRTHISGEILNLATIIKVYIDKDTIYYTESYYIGKTKPDEFLPYTSKLRPVSLDNSLSKSDFDIIYSLIKKHHRNKLLTSILE